MRVTGARNVFAAGAKLHGRDGFGDQVAGARADNMDAEYSVDGGIGQNLNATCGVANAARTAIGLERKNAFAVFNAGFFELLFRFADGGNFGFGIHNAGNGVVIDMAVASDKMLDSGHAFFGRFVRQHRAGNDIANRKDILG